jgi:hypothetical protein
MTFVADCLSRISIRRAHWVSSIRVLGSCDEHDRGNRRFLVRIGGQLARHLDHYQHHETALMGDSADEILERIRPVCNN